MQTPEYLTWDQLADLYKERTGGNARTKPMQEIYRWAANQPDIRDSDNGLRMVKPQKKAVQAETHVCILCGEVCESILAHVKVKHAEYYQPKPRKKDL